MNILYGVEGNYKNVTNLVLQRCIVKPNNIFIPQGDENRAAIFGDPAFGQLKHICITYNDKKIIYPHYQQVNIPNLIQKQESGTWVIITSSLINRNFDIRKEQYTKGIKSLVDRCNKSKKKYNVVLVENNGSRHTFFNELECVKNGQVRLLYTNNNFLPVWNFGTKEQLDVLACIEQFNIPDDDFVIKFSGRYFLDDDCPFFDAVDNGEYDAVVRFGNYKTAPMEKCGDCILGLVGMRCKYLKTVKVPDIESVELNWAAVAKDLPNVFVIRGYIGIWIAPGSNEFYKI